MHRQTRQPLVFYGEGEYNALDLQAGKTEKQQPGTLQYSATYNKVIKSWPSSPIILI